MRKFTLLLGAISLASIVPATPAMAEGGIVIGDGTCSGFVPTLEGGKGPSLSGGDVHIVTHGGKSTLTCHLDIPDNLLPPKGVKAVGQTCTTPLGPTNDSKMQASPGGRATGTCWFGRNK